MRHASEQTRIRIDAEHWDRNRFARSRGDLVCVGISTSQLAGSDGGSASCFPPHCTPLLDDLLEVSVTADSSSGEHIIR
jgi:hypothetical protein